MEKLARAEQRPLKIATDSEFITGRNQIIAFLSRKWAQERDYRLIKEMWAFTGNRIAVRFAYEWQDDSDHWYRSYGNENWEFNDDGLMASRFASINDIPILGSARKYLWVLGQFESGICVPTPRGRPSRRNTSGYGQHRAGNDF